MDEMRKHPDTGHQMIQAIPFLSTAAEIAAPARRNGGTKAPGSGRRRTAQVAGVGAIADLTDGPEAPMDDDTDESGLVPVYVGGRKTAQG